MTPHQQSVTIAAPVRPFTPEQRATLDALMELMIPASRDGSMPSAASLGLYADPGALPGPARAHFERGLAALEAAAARDHGQAFATLSSDQALALIERFRRDDPPFINALTVHTMARYVQHDQVMRLLGLEPRPHWPLGHEVPEGDWSLLEAVRQRGPIWRSPG